jgi:hypothetical protein
VQVREQDTPVRVLRRVSHRIIEELDLRPPKARAWEEKRHKMKQMSVALPCCSERSPTPAAGL